MKDENFLWAGIPFMGGISGANMATCGAVSAGAMVLGFRHRAPLDNRDAAKAGRDKARKSSAHMMKQFIEEFGNVNCRDLLGIDFSVPGNYKKFKTSGIAEGKCYRYVDYVIETIYALEKNQSKA